MNKKDNLFIRILSLILCLTILPINVLAINQSSEEYKTDEVISEKVDAIDQSLDTMELHHNNDAQQTLGSSTSVSILPTDDTYVHGSSVNTNYGEDQKVVILNGRNTTTGKATGRFVFFKYDLNDLSIPNGSITSASIKLTRTSGSGPTPLIFGLVEDTVFSQNWSEDTLTYTKVNEAEIEPFELKRILVDQTPSKTGEAHALSYDITHGAQIAQNISDYDGKLTLVVFFGPRADGTFSPVGCDLATKENTNEFIRPYLTLEVNDDTDLGNAIKDKVWIDEQIPVEVTENLSLPTIGQNGSEISWESSDTSLIEENGVVTRPSNQEGDKAVVLTGTISNGEQKIMHEFEVLVKALPMTDEEKALEDMEYIKSNLDGLTVISDIQFPESIELPNQSSVTYVSSDPEHLGDDGTVVRPEVEEPSATVTLTVEVKNGSVTKTSDINIIVQPLGSSTSVSILPTDDTYVHGSSVNTNYGEDQKVVILNGRNTTTGKATGRFVFFKYDLNDLSIPNGSITSASIKLTRISGSGSTPLIFGLIEDTVFSKNWSESNLTYSGMNEAGVEPFELKRILTAQTPSKTGEEYALSYDITHGAQIVQNISDYDGKLTLVVFFGPRADGTFSPVGCDLATKENTNEFIRPYLTLEVNDDTDLGNAIKDKVWIDEQIPVEVTENLSLPTIGQNGSEISWESSDTSLIEENGVVTRPSNQEGDKAVVLTGTISNGEQKIMHEFEVLVKALPMTDEEKALEDMEYIKSNLDGLTVISDIQFPESIELPNQSSVTYVSSDPEHLGDDGTVVRPEVEEPSATVTLTVEVKNGSAMGIEYITIYVQKQLMSMNEYIKEDLGNILDAAKELITRPNHIQKQIIIEPEQLTDTSNMPTGSVVGDKWGQYPQESVDKFQSVINNAQIVYDTHQKDENIYYLSSNDLIQAGIDFIKSANIDDSVLVRNQQDHKLLFSAYRRDLMAYVWEAETLLMLEPYFYPKSAKLALQKYIDEAKEALDYTHKFPFVRSRGFIVPRKMSI